MSKHSVVQPIIPALQRPALLRQQVVEVLRTAIVEGRYGPGDRLVERNLCLATGVSRTLVREALRQLEAERLVVVIANKGPVVATIEPDEARALYEVRGVLEALASKLAAEHGRPLVKRQLSHEFRKFANACIAEDLRLATRAKTRFYEVLFECTQNDVLKGQLELIFARTSLLRAMTLSAPGRLQRSLQEIEALTTAILAGDGEAAWPASLKHVESASSVLADIQRQKIDQ